MNNPSYISLEAILADLKSAHQSAESPAPEGMLLSHHHSRELGSLSGTVASAILRLEHLLEAEQRAK